MNNCVYLKIVKLLNRVNWTLAGFLVLLCVFFVGLTLHKPTFREAAGVKSTSKGSDFPIDLSGIEKGPLALPVSEEAFPLPGFRDEFLFLGLNQRPDCARAEILLKLKSSGEKRVCALGEMFFLDYESGRPVFANGSGALAVNPKLSRGRLVLDVSLELKSLGIKRHASWIFDPIKARASVEPGSALAGAVEHLKRSKIWGPDQLLSLYGGSDFEKALPRIALNGQMVSLGIGDMLVWKKQQWQEMDDEDEGLPLAQVSKVGDRGVEFVLWSDDGFEQAKQSVALQRPVNLSFKAQDLIKNLRKRTRSSVSAQIGGKPRVLRVGDWLMKQGGSWKVLRSLKEVDACIKGTLLGELLIVDRIEASGSQSVLKGHVFDERRTQGTEISLAFGGSNSHQKTPKSKPRIRDFDDDDDLLFDDDDDDDFLNSLMSGDDDD